MEPPEVVKEAMNEVLKEALKKTMYVIQILGKDSPNLIMSDKGHSVVSPCTRVIWLVHPESGVKNISAINRKPNSANIFETSPEKIGNSPNWHGKIRCDIKEITYEDYNIVWEDGEKTHTYDPRISVNPDS